MAELLELTVAQLRFEALLIDSCVLIDDYNGQSAILSRLARDQRRTSDVALWEFLHGPKGASLGRDVRRLRRQWLDDHGVRSLGLSDHCAMTFRPLLHADDGPPSAVDCLLAAESKSRGWPLLTANFRHFAMVDGLKIVPVTTHE